MYDPVSRTYASERKQDHSGNPILIFFFVFILIGAVVIGGLGSSAIDFQSHRDPNATGVFGWVEQADKNGIQRGRIVWPWEDLRTARVVHD